MTQQLGRQIITRQVEINVIIQMHPQIKHSAYLVLAGTILMSSCAYFNTFYNARQYYETGLTALAQTSNRGSDKIPKNAAAAFGTAIEKCKKVIEKYPESRYIDDALLIMGKSHYYREEFGLAERYFQELLSDYPEIPYQNEVRVWLAKVHAEMGMEDAVEEDLAPILEGRNPSADILAEVYIIRAEMALARQSIREAMLAFEAAAQSSSDPALRADVWHRLYQLADTEQQYQQAMVYLAEFARATPNEKERVNAQLTRIQMMQKLGEIERASEEIAFMMGLTEYSSIIPGLLLESGKIARQRGDSDTAMDIFIRIIEEYPNIPETGETSFEAGEIELQVRHDVDAAMEHFKRIRRNHPLYQSARAKITQLNLLSKLDKRIKKLRAELLEAEPEVAPADTAAADQPEEQESEVLAQSSSVDTLAIREDLARALFRLGEIRLFEMDDSETGLRYLGEIAGELAETDEAAQAAYVLFVFSEENPEQAQFWKNVLYERYPLSEYSRAIADTTGMLHDDGLDSLQTLVNIAVAQNPREALRIFRRIRDKFDTDQASFSIGYLYDEYFAELDSAIWAYQEHLNAHPTGKYTEQATDRLDFLLSVKADETAGNEETGESQP